MDQGKCDRYLFASDNTAGICPEAWAQLERANGGAVPAYGEDSWTRQVETLVRDIFETDCAVHLVFSGTAANSLALAQLCQPYHAVLCHERAHIHTDECGAPEFFCGGSKLLLVSGTNGKISLDAAAAVCARHQDVHSHKPRVISVTQATELGTVYTPEEILAVTEFARAHHMFVHMDGARFANAVSTLRLAPREITWRAGVDVLSFGGTKNGLTGGELVVFFKPELAAEFEYRVKQAGQLGSKQRFIAAQWHGLLANGAWLRNAELANAAARRLGQRLRNEVQLETVFPPEANALFVRLRPDVYARIQDSGWRFYKFIEPDIYRLMCSWATNETDIERLVHDLKLAAGGNGPAA